MIDTSVKLNVRNTLLFTYSTNILVHLLTVNIYKRTVIKPGFHMIVPVVSKNFETTETIAGFHMIVSIASNTEDAR